VIQIDKPEEAPEVLIKKGKKKRAANCRSYTRSKAKYNSGEKTFDFDLKIYGDKKVKQKLIDCQHGKCCFCESDLVAVAYGDVEHYRPKGGYQQTESEDLQKPGYYWLAYEWKNLFFSCQLCNQKYKRNLFPLEDKNKRAKTHKDKIEKEDPLFVNPTVDNPERYIKYRKEVAFSVNGSKKGAVTINNIGLNRDKLRERRLKMYSYAKTLWEIIEVAADSKAKDNAKRWLERSNLESSEYASMMRCAMEAKFKNGY